MKIAIITGGAQGIGRGIAQRLLEDGYGVALWDHERKIGLKTEAFFRPRFSDVAFFQTDVGSEPSVRKSLAQTVKRFEKIHALINNAGRMIRRPLARLGIDEWNAVLATNLTGAFLCTKEAAPYLRRSGGVIVNMASTRALMSEKDTESYSATKGGLVALTHALAISMGPAIRVHCISPGWIDTSRYTGEGKPAKLSRADHAQHPVGRVGQPEDIAALVAFLLSNGSGFMTGENIVIDGGMTRKMIYVED